MAAGVSCLIWFCDLVLCFLSSLATISLRMGTRYKIQETSFFVGYSTTNNISHNSYFPT